MMGRSGLALLLLIGTIVGVGMFGIPFVFVRSGFLLGVVELGIVAIASTLVHLAYASVVLGTPEFHRLPGYVTYYLGPKLGWLSRLSYLFGLSGTLLAYLVLGGMFLQELFTFLYPGLSQGVGILSFYAIGIAILFRGIRFESVANAFLTLGLVVAVALLVLALVPDISLANLVTFSASNFFAPYGVLLFSMAGAAVVPDVIRVLARHDGKAVSRIVVLGTMLPALMYLAFAVAVVGTTGDGTSPDAVSGIALRYGTGYLLAGNLVGFLATITSFIAIGIVLKGTFVSDFRLPSHFAWFLTAAIPAGLFVAGFQDFIAIVSVVGAVAIGLDSIFILAVERSVASKGASGLRFRLSPGLRAFLAALFAFGILYEFFRLR